MSQLGKRLWPYAEYHGAFALGALTMGIDQQLAMGVFSATVLATIVGSFAAAAERNRSVPRDNQS